MERCFRLAIPAGLTIISPRTMVANLRCVVGEGPSRRSAFWAGGSMRTLSLAFIAVVVAASAFGGQGSPAAGVPSLTVIRAGVLIDGSSDAARRNQLIFIRGERIDRIA